MKRLIRFFALAFGVVIAACLPLEAAEWPQWRGPERDGHAPGEAWPDDFSSLERLWQVPLGKGYPGPIVAEDRVFVVETVDDETVAVRALDRDGGGLLWRHEWDGEGSVPFFARANGDWVRSTPAWDGRTLYVGDMSEVLLALDGESGEVKWRVDFPALFGTDVPPFGFASSPLVDGDHLYVQAANSLVKMDARDGSVVWRRLEVPGDMTDAGAFSSPVLATLGGIRQIVTQDRNALHGVDPDEGGVIWSMPLPHFRGMHILTPAVWGDFVFTSPYRVRSYMMRIAEGHIPLEAWTHKATGYMSSPVIVDGHAYLHLGNKRVECIDLETGESRWRSKESFGKYWSMAWRGDRILALDEDGTLYLLAADPAAFTVLDRREVADTEAWGHIAVSGEELFVRDLEGISAFRWGGGPRQDGWSGP